MRALDGNEIPSFGDRDVGHGSHDRFMCHLKELIQHTERLQIPVRAFSCSQRRFFDRVETLVKFHGKDGVSRQRVRLSDLKGVGRIDLHRSCSGILVNGILPTIIHAPRQKLQDGIEASQAHAALKRKFPARIFRPDIDKNFIGRPIQKVLEQIVAPLGSPLGFIIGE